MTRKHLLAQCLEPTAITEQALRVCIAVASDDAYFADERAKAAIDAGEIFGFSRKMSVENGVATIAVEGPLVRKAGGVKNISGLTSYEAIRADLRAAKADPSVRSIDWFFDTPGGVVSGLFETADEIKAMRGVKPMRAVVAEANSAGYVLAAAVGNIEIEQTGEAGSVGVVYGYEVPDQTGAKVIKFVSSVSPLKNADPATDAGRTAMQERVDHTGELLVAKVAELRGVSVETVKEQFGKGGVMQGAQAVAAGLADRVGSITSTRGAQMSQTTSAAAGLAAGPTAGPMQCNKCGGSCSASDDGDEDTNAAADFGRKAMTLLGATDHATALGLVKAGADELTAQATARVKAAADAKAQAGADFFAAIKGGIEGGKLTLATAASVLDFIDDDQAGKVKAALAEPNRAATIDAAVAAFALAEVTPREAKSVKTFIDSKGPALPTAHKPPANTKGNRAEVHKQLVATATANGIPQAAVQSFANLTIAEIEAKVEQSNRKQGA